MAFFWTSAAFNEAVFETAPVLLPTKAELTSKFKTAKTLGPTVPPSPLATADEVIE